MDLFQSLDQVEDLFKSREPQILAFVPEEVRFERLRREASNLLACFPDPASRPPLFGWLVGVKDIFHVSGFSTRAGSRLPAEIFQGQEAESVTRLKSAGALILGKTATTEFAYFSPGPTRNPHNPEHTPGGSSSGSAAAVAAGFCPLALGSQTIGSIIRPAAFCGVVGLKPSYERISRSGVIPLSPSVDHIGFFTRDVAGARRAAGCLYVDWRPDQRASKRPVLGIPEGPYLEKASAEGRAHFNDVCQRLEAAGYRTRRVAALKDFAEIAARHQVLVAAEAAQVHTDWFDRYADLYAPKTAELIRSGQAVTGPELDDAREGRIRLRAELEEQMEAQGIDLWISPPAPGPAPPGLDSTGDPVMNLPWTHAGMPAIHLPAKKNQAGLPMGLQVTGRYGADEELLDWAGALEEALA